MGKKNRARNKNKKKASLSTAAAMTTTATTTAGRSTINMEEQGRIGDSKPPAPQPSTEKQPAAAAAAAAADITTNPRPDIQPGRIALVQGLKNRCDLNEKIVTIKSKLPNGRVAVEVCHHSGSDIERKETVSIKSENLICMNQKNKVALEPWHQAETCDICMDAAMVINGSPERNAGVYPCCGKKMCGMCWDKMKNKKGSKCPFCNSKVAISDAGVVAQIRARADRGDLSAMNCLGTFYFFGCQGLPQDRVSARTWFQKAALQGPPVAMHCNDLAMCHFSGYGGPVNYEEAARWFRVASDLGGVEATTYLALMHMRGLGVHRDLNMAKELLKRSMGAGDERAKKTYEMLCTAVSLHPMLQPHFLDKISFV